MDRREDFMYNLGVVMGMLRSPDVVSFLINEKKVRPEHIDVLNTALESIIKDLYK